MSNAQPVQTWSAEATSHDQTRLSRAGGRFVWDVGGDGGFAEPGETVANDITSRSPFEVLLQDYPRPPFGTSYSMKDCLRS